jgi:hypothetical protein
MPAVSSCRNWALELFHEMTRSQTSLDAVSYGSPSDNRNWVGSSDHFSRSLQLVELDQCWTQPGTPERHSASSTQLALHASPICKFIRVIYNIEIYIQWQVELYLDTRSTDFVGKLIVPISLHDPCVRWMAMKPRISCGRLPASSAVAIKSDFADGSSPESVVQCRDRDSRWIWTVQIADDWDVLRHRHDHLDTMATLTASNSHTMK